MERRDTTWLRGLLPRAWAAILISLGAAVIVLALLGLYLRAAGRIEHTALSQSPKPVTTVLVQRTEFQPLREYVGVTSAWNEARLGPQYVSAYVAAVLYRPGMAVKRGEVLATLDCRFTSASSREVAARARALAERQAASRDEARRTEEIAAGGFASTNEVEKLRAKATAESAEVEGLREDLMRKKIEEDDCILRAPFDGEIIDRFVDPGAYLRPGEPVLTIADRSTVRVVGDAPEDDYAIVTPATRVQIAIAASHARLTAPISRRTPATDRSTRTIRFEIDIDNRTRQFPIGSTARIQVPVGAPQPASLVPLQAAALRQQTATLFIVADSIAHSREVRVLGERQGLLYLDPSLVPGTQVVLEGAALLNDNERVSASLSTGPS